VLLRGVDLPTTTLPVPAAFLHPVLWLSLSVSAHPLLILLCTALPFLASRCMPARRVRWARLHCLVALRHAHAAALHILRDGRGGGDGDSKQASAQQPSPALAPAPTPNASFALWRDWDPADRLAIGRGSRTSLSAHHRLQLSPAQRRRQLGIAHYGHQRDTP
jgi:hypothetical protein